MTWPRKHRKTVIQLGSKLQIPSNSLTTILFFRFGTSVRRDPKRAQLPCPGTYEAPEYIKIKSHNVRAADMNKTMFTTQEQELRPEKLKEIRDKMSAKEDGLGPG